MSTTRRPLVLLAVLLGLVAVLGGLLFFFLPGNRSGEPALDGPPATAGAAQEAPAPPRSVRAPRPAAEAPTTDRDTDGGADPAAPDTIQARVHRTFAEQAGLSLIRCPVPEHLQGGTPSGDHAPRIAAGWFSDLVSEPAGQRVIYDRLEDPDQDREPLFTVAWEGDEGDLEVPCTVHEALWGAVRVRVRPEDGALPDVPLQVTGCGGNATVGEDGIAILDEVRAGLPCKLMAVDPRGLGCAGHVRLTPAPDTETEVALDLTCVDLADPTGDDVEDFLAAVGIPEEPDPPRTPWSAGDFADLAERLLEDPAFADARPMLERIADYRREEQAFVDQLEAAMAEGDADAYRSPPPFTALP